MRPDVFRDYLIDVAKNAPGVQRVQPLQEVGEERYPYGVAVTAAGRETRWQITGQLADGEKSENPAADIEGQPAAFTPGDPGTPDAWLAGVIGAAESPQIAKLDVWSQREANRADHIGCTVFFHNTARAFVRKI
ncbi:hypothetical protein ACFVT5_06230 [Streptomyces sp. NPDC058001]|uniref:hypothetical protein n=1 Tax=Streptomyces sp. NPDC058001 TaxID=3346300 RepID=UPI0036E223A9